MKKGASRCGTAVQLSSTFACLVLPVEQAFSCSPINPQYCSEIYHTSYTRAGSEDRLHFLDPFYVES